MLAAYRRSMRHGFGADDVVADTPVTPRADPLPFASAEPGRFGRGPNWTAIGIVVLAHAALLFALVRMDIISIGAPPPKPTVVTLIPEIAAPPPPPPKTPIEPIKPLVAKIVTPPPLVTVPTPTAPVVATTPTPPPPQAVAVAPPTAVPGPPAPITPPDASAASLKNPSPRYPMESRREHEEGTVRLRVIITVDGQVKDIEVARSSGSERLDKAALDAVRRWKFVPGMQAGKPVEAMGFLNIPFKLAA